MSTTRQYCEANSALFYTLSRSASLTCKVTAPSMGSGAIQQGYSLHLVTVADVSNVTDVANVPTETDAAGVAGMGL